MVLVPSLIKSTCLLFLKEVPQPEFITKPEIQWTDEERRNYKEYEKKVKELSEEKEKYKKVQTPFYLLVFFWFIDLFIQFSSCFCCHPL